MIIRKCRKLMKLDNEDITVVDRDVAKNYENFNNSDMRPNTSVGVAHYNNKIEELFPSENKGDMDENLSSEAENQITNNDQKPQVAEFIEKVNTNKTQNNSIDNESKLNNVSQNAKETNNKITKSVVDYKKKTNTQTMSNFSVKDKVITQVQYVSKSNKVFYK